MVVGTVKWFSPVKGYSFIAPDVSAHVSAVEQAGMSPLDEGQKISFDAMPDRRGKFAAIHLQAA